MTGLATLSILLFDLFLMVRFDPQPISWYRAQRLARDQLTGYMSSLCSGNGLGVL
jgi:hypothetical protein